MCVENSDESKQNQHKAVVGLLGSVFDKTIIEIGNLSNIPINFTRVR